MNKLSQPLILLAIVVCLNVIGSAFARVIVVKPGQDLAEIVARARPGTQILLAPGVFELKAKPPHQQCILIQKKKGLKISAKYPQKTVLRLSADAKFGFYIGSDVEQLFISGLRIEGSLPLKTNTHAIGSYSGTTNVRNVSITGLDIQNVAVGISISTSDKGIYENVRVSGNTVRNLVGVDPGSGYGIHVENIKNVVISQNVIDNAGRHSIYLARAGKDANITVRGNLIVNHNREKKQPRWYAAALVCSRSSSVLIVDNVIVNPQSIGISIERDEIRGVATQGIRVVHNHIINVPFVGIWLTTGNSHLGLGNRIILDPKPAHPQWCKAISVFDFATGKPTDSSLTEPNARWKAPDFVAGMDNRLFVLKDGVLDDISTADWRFKTCPTKFPDVTGISAFKMTTRRGSERLLIATKTGLKMVSPATWRILKNYPQWNKVRLMAFGNGQLFVIQDEVLHKLDINRLSSQDQMADQKNVQWMGVIAGRLCVVKEGKHHWVDWKK